jgi:hypothetical protein
MTTNYYIESLKETRTDYLPQLLEALVSKDYSIVEMEDWKDQVFLLVESDNIEGQILEGKLYFDSKECFNKPLSCCLQLPIPTNQHQVNFILDKLEWLVTEGGKAYSDDFNYIEDYE